MAVVWHELTGSPRWTFSRDSVQCQRVLVCAWEDWPALMIELFGRRTIFSPAVSKTAPGFPWALVENASVQPYSEDLIPTGMAPSYDLTNTYGGIPGALVNVTFSTREGSTADNSEQQRPGLPTVPEGTYLSYQYSTEPEVLTIPGRKLQWSDDPTIPVPEDLTGGILIPNQTHSLTWSAVPSPPWEVIRDRVGTVNNAEFLGAAAETLLLASCSVNAEFSVDPDQPLAWKLAYQFQERRIAEDDGDGGQNVYGWLHQYREEPSGWAKLETLDGNGLYRATSFDELFQDPGA